jgi:murein L,D-transpeptidase YcbB/YkuD
MSILKAAFAFFILIGVSAYAGDNGKKTLQEELRSLPIDSLFPPGRDPKYFSAQLDSFYMLRNYQAIWSGSSQLDSLRNLIEEVGNEGLRPNDYVIDKIQAKNGARKSFWKRFLPSPKPTENQLDIQTTASCIALAAHLYGGRIDPALVDPRIHNELPTMSFAAFLDSALQINGLSKALKGLLPSDPQYRLLRASLNHYRALFDQGGWPSVNHDTLHLGAQGDAVRALEMRLLKEGDLDRQPTGNYDQALVAAVKAYQTRHDLKADGVVGPTTLKTLQKPIEEEIRRIVINMDRFRWVPRDTLPLLVTINIPEFRLALWDQGREMLQMKTIVGKQFNATPIFEDSLEYIVLNPSWTVPKSIVNNELWKRLKKNPGGLAESLDVYLGTEHSGTPLKLDSVPWSKMGSGDLDRFKFVYRSGPTNPLGRIKFMMPNSLDVYLHDTPTHQLFDSTQRGFSHGCIRVERAADLAAYLLLSTGKWGKQEINDSIASGKTDTILLSQKVPVRILYRTVFINQFSQICFKEDIYGYDTGQVQVLSNLKFWDWLSRK